MKNALRSWARNMKQPFSLLSFLLVLLKVFYRSWFFTAFFRRGLHWSVWPQTFLMENETIFTFPDFCSRALLLFYRDIWGRIIKKNIKQVKVFRSVLCWTCSNDNKWHRDLDGFFSALFSWSPIMFLGFFGLIIYCGEGDEKLQLFFSL